MAHLVWKDEILNLDLYHKIHREHRGPANRLYLDIRAGGSQEGNGREVLDFEDEDQRDEAFDLISAFLATGAPCFDIQAHFDEMMEAIDDDTVPVDNG